MSSPVYIVHCIDTEGPLHESLEATFQRLNSLFGLELEPDRELLRRLQAAEVDLGGIEQAVRKVVDPHLLAYNDTWDKIDTMLADCMSDRFRRRMLDSVGGGWVYNWFCVDHVDYDSNPRRRDIGYHNIFDHYRAAVREYGAQRDGLQFHYHPHPPRKEAHLCATHWWASSDSLYQTLSRRVIERGWFPAVNRPGFHVTRPDSHWFLEQYVPFDYAGQAVAVAEQGDAAQFRLGEGRFGDWRRAPANWQPYHPSHDDYQVAGNCRRWIARCLNVGTRYKLLNEEDVAQAFHEAQQGLPVVLSFTNHDFRDMRPDVEVVRQLLQRVAPRFPGVPFIFSEAGEAMRSALALPAQPPCELELTMSSMGGGAHVLQIRSQTPTFGPQPWLAFRTAGGRYHHDNLDIEVPFHSWQYVFDEQTYRLAELDAIGVAANNACGATTVALMDPATHQVRRCHWNVKQTEEYNDRP